MWFVLFCNYWTRLVFGYKEIARKELEWNFVWLERICKKVKNNIEKIKMKFWMEKKNVRILKEEIKKRKKNWDKKEYIFLKVIVAFFCHLSSDLATLATKN